MFYKLLKIQALAALLLSLTPISYADPINTDQTKPEYIEGETVYVSDRVNIELRSGPSSNYRIVDTRNVGDKLTFVRLSENQRFALVETAEGQQRWIALSYIQKEPCGKAAVESLTLEVNKLRTKLENYDSELKSNLKQALDRLSVLEKENSALKISDAQKQETISKLDEERRDYRKKLETKDLDMQMRWWLQGALIALGGAIIGVVFLFIPRPNRKKRDRF